jgi:hypothetical protein
MLISSASWLLPPPAVHQQYPLLQLQKHSSIIHASNVRENFATHLGSQGKSENQPENKT